MSYSPKKEVNDSLLVELLRQELSQTTNQFKNNCLWLADESITLEELGKLLGQPTAKITAFF